VKSAAPIIKDDNRGASNNGKKTLPKNSTDICEMVDYRHRNRNDPSQASAGITVEGNIT
jgi:hypothetical protein